MRAKPSKKPTSSKQSSPYLVQDVLDIILEQLYDFTQPRTSQRAFAQYALISRAWRHSAQWFLFQEVSIRYPRQLASLQELFKFKTKRSTYLASLVKSLKIFIDGVYTFGNVTQEDLVPAMRLFPNLYRVRVGLYYVHRLYPHVVEALEQTPSIEALSIFEWHTVPGEHNFGVISNVPLQFLTIPHWNLKHFEIRGSMWISRPPQRIPPPRHRFVEVRIACWSEWDGSLLAFTRWTLHNSKATLRVFSSDKDGLHVFTKYLRSLQSLELPSVERWSHSIASIGMNLREVMWMRSAPTPEMKGSLGRIQHIGMDACSNIRPSRWYLSCKNACGPLLKRISVINCQQHTAETPDLKRLGAEAEEKLEVGIEVRLYPSYKEYAAATLPPLVPSESFPQVPSLRDFSKMTGLINAANRDGLVKRGPPGGGTYKKAPQLWKAWC